MNYGIRFTEESELDAFLRQLCTEVHNRLADIRSKGKTITLKYMVRAKEAPVETAKFMGHGFCDNVTKSTTLPSFTCDLDVIMQTIFSIKNNLNIPPNELRGIGIQISKLSATGNDAAKSNVLRNMFERASEKLKTRKVETVVEVHQRLNLVIPEPKRPKEDVKTSVPVKSKRGIRKAKSFNSGSADIAHMFNTMPTHQNKVQKMYQEMDLNVLAELPEDIREQVLREQKIVLKRIPSNNWEPKIESRNNSHNENRLSHGENDSRNTSTSTENGEPGPSTSSSDQQSNTVRHLASNNPLHLKLNPFTRFISDAVNDIERQYIARAQVVSHIDGMAGEHRQPFRL